MGYRIKLSNANSVGHLIEGNILSFINQCFIDKNYLDGNIEYIDDFLSIDNHDFISSDPKRFESLRSKLRSEWKHVKALMKSTYDRITDNNSNYILKLSEESIKINLFFKEVSKLLGGYKYRFLLLPGFENNEINNLLVNPIELIKLLTIETSSSYLILQLKQIPEKNDVQILDSFEHMNKAIARVDEWPGVLVWGKEFWGRSEGMFIPIKGIDDVASLIYLHNYENSYLKLLLKVYGHKRTKRISQFVHLSDLHLGTRGEENKKLRLIEVLKKHIRINDSFYNMYPIISGDLVDTPSIINVKLYESFESQLDSIGLKNPITVLGNHDVRDYGFIRGDQEGKNILRNLVNKDSIVVLDDLKLILILFDSNIGGDLAKGTIGQEQLLKLGNQIDRLNNKQDYFKIAILHHHPFELERPDWMRKTWYENILGKINYDVDQSNKLLDSDIFITWLKSRNISFIIHGHKHIPKLFHMDGFDIVAGGSSTGKIDHIESDRTFLTYNLINYDLDKYKPISSTIVFEDILGSGTKNYQVEVY